MFSMYMKPASSRLPDNVILSLELIRSTCSLLFEIAIIKLSRLSHIMIGKIIAIFFQLSVLDCYGP